MCQKPTEMSEEGINSPPLEPSHELSSPRVNPDSENFQITPAKTRSVSSRARASMSPQQRTPSLQDKPIPILSPPPNGSSGEAPRKVSKSQQHFSGTPVRSTSSSSSGGIHKPPRVRRRSPSPPPETVGNSEPQSPRKK